MLTKNAVSLFLVDREASNCRPATLLFYREQLARLDAYGPDLPRDPAVLRALIGAVKGAPASRACTFRALRALYRWLLSQGLLTDDPMALVRSPKVPKLKPRTLDRPAVGSLLDVALSVRDRAMVELLLDGGIRSGELRTLRGRDLGEDYITVDGKTGQRRVPLHARTIAQLRDLADGPDDLIFRTIEGKPLTRNRTYLIVRRALELAGVAGTSKRGPHTLRHSMATDWVKQGGSLPGLQSMLGHSNVTTTMIYVTLAQKDVSAEHQRVGLFATPKPPRKLSVVREQEDRVS